MSETTINAAIEHLVRVDASDRDALVTALRELAGLVEHDLVAKAPLVHRFFGGHWEGDVYIAACGSADRDHRDHKGIAINCPACLKTLEDEGYETDAAPTSQYGDHGTCAVCGTRIHYSANWHDDGGWWAHAAERPADGHHAVLGGAA